VQRGDLQVCRGVFEEEALAEAESTEEREEISNHWPWEDIDEEKYI